MGYFRSNISESGFTLVEAMITMAVALGGMLALATYMNMMQKTQRSLATSSEMDYTFNQIQNVTMDISGTGKCGKMFNEVSLAGIESGATPKSFSIPPPASPLSPAGRTRTLKDATDASWLWTNKQIDGYKVTSMEVIRITPAILSGTTYEYEAVFKVKLEKTLADGASNIGTPYKIKEFPLSMRSDSTGQVSDCGNMDSPVATICRQMGFRYDTASSTCLPSVRVLQQFPTRFDGFNEGAEDNPFMVTCPQGMGVWSVRYRQQERVNQLQLRCKYPWGPGAMDLAPVGDPMKNFGTPGGFDCPGSSLMNGMHLWDHYNHGPTIIGELRIDCVNPTTNATSQSPLIAPLGGTGHLNNVPRMCDPGEMVIGMSGWARDQEVQAISLLCGPIPLKPK